MINGVVERWNVTVPSVGTPPGSRYGAEIQAGVGASTGQASVDTFAFSGAARLQAQGVAAPSAISPTKLQPETCKTCEDRRYQDGSDDPTVSFQSPTALSANEAGMAVQAHEGEHVRNEQIRAKQEGREVVSQSVIVHTGVCPECGKVYVAGGETITTTRGARRAQPSPGARLDVSA